jgi:hypothetical protein
VRLHLEALEGRTLLNAYTAATVSDLIADINAANQTGGSNTIALTAPTTSPYSLTAVDNTTDGATGLPVIANGDNLTITGNADTIERSTADSTPLFRLFDVAGGASLALDNLTLQNGNAFGSGNSAQGGAIFNQGTLTLSHDVISSNQAQGATGQGSTGGGIANANGARLTIGDSLFSNNMAVGGDSGGGGQGGAIGNISNSHLTVTDSNFAGNLAQGGNGGVAGSGAVTNVGNASGGAIRTNGKDGDATITGCVFTNNQAIAGNNNTGASSTGGGSSLTVVGSSLGGAIGAVGNGELKVSDSVFIGNQAVGGKDNSGGSPRRNLVGVAGGGAILVSTSPGNLTTGFATIDKCTFTNNQAVGGAGSLLGSGSPSNLNLIGAGAGGAIVGVDGGKPTVTNSTLAHNQAVGGTGADGHDGGAGLGGGIGVVAGGPPTQFTGSLTMSNDTLAHNQAIGGVGGDGGSGGNGRGGGLYNDSNNAEISFSRVVGNRAIGGAGGNGGDGMGGGFYNASSVPATLIDSIVHGNKAIGGAEGAGGKRGEGQDNNIFGPVTEVTTHPGTMLIDALMSLLGHKDKQGS